MEKLKENIETQQPKKDETSISIVKTPLVDALHLYFASHKAEEIAA